MNEYPLNPRLRGLGLSPTVAINELSDRLRAQGRRVVKLGLGQSPFPIPHVVVEALRDHAPEKAYLPVRGLFELRDAVAEYHRRACGAQSGADDVLIGPGSKELMFVLQVVFDGEILIPTPAWVSYAPQAQIVGRRIRYIHAGAENRWKITPAELAHACAEVGRRPRLLILNSPSNPTGVAYSAEELAELAQVARAHQLVVLSDEIYSELHYQARSPSIARHYPEGTIISAGLSKWCGAGGWRLGTFTFPPDLRWLLEAMAAVASETYTSTSAPIQHAAVRAFRGGPEISDYLQVARRILAALAQHLTARLRTVGIDVAAPDGAFYLFLDFTPLRTQLVASGIPTDRDICVALLERGIATLPGSGFGRAPAALTVRLAFVDFDGARAQAAAASWPEEQDLDESFLRAHAFDVLTGVEAIARWASELG